MWFEDDADFMRQMVRYTVPNADTKENRNRVKHLYRFQPAPQILPKLVLYYPGYKDAVGDYKLTFYSKELKHSEICQAIFEYSMNNEDYSERMTLVLREIYENGLSGRLQEGFEINIFNKRYNFEQFKTLLYWITLQEEINYPLSHNYLSVKLPFSRYLESILVAFTNQAIVSIDQIRERADSRNPYRCWEDLDDIPQNIPDSMIELSELLWE